MEPVLDPRTAKGRATRERIVRAAAQRMYAQGVAVTSVEEVKATAGVSSSQLYHYFADKQSLVGAVVDHQAELVLGFQESLLAAPGGDAASDGLPALRAWREEIIARLTRDGTDGGCPLGSLASELRDREPVHRRALAAAFDRWEEAIRALLERMRDRGELKDDADVQSIAAATLASLQGGLLLAQTRRDVTPLRAALDAALDHIAAQGTAVASAHP